jgi:hypothetical protein
MGTLKMYRVDDDGEHHHAIAESEQDALSVMVECGISDAKTIDDYVRDYNPTLKERECGETITMTEDDGRKTTRTVAEWIGAQGRGLLCSSVF